MASPSPTSNPSPVRRRRWRRRVLLIAGPLVFLAAGLVFYLHGGRYVSTDNAFVRADKVAIAPEVSGIVRSVDVSENQVVVAGQQLFRLDDESARLALAEAEAKLAQVRNDLTSLVATYREKTAGIAADREALDYAQRELDREQALAEQQVSSEMKLDEAQHAVDAAARQLAVKESEAQTVLTSLGGSVDRPITEHPRFVAAQAARDQAARALRLTVVRAPQDGVVTNVPSLQVGRYVAATQPALSLIVVDHVWVEANVKETQLTHIAPGAPVTVNLDTYPGRTWHGTVATISPATGAEFALIPPQNASGNWVKVVQRVPVEVDLTPLRDAPVLRAGMSATVEIDTGHERSLSDLTHTLAGWFHNDENDGDELAASPSAAATSTATASTQRPNSALPH